MNTYKIKQDQTVNYPDGNQLYVMIILDNGRYLIQIDTRAESIGRKYAKDLKVANRVMEQVMTRLNEYEDYYSAVEMLDLAFSLNTLNAFMFIVNVLGRAYTQDAIYQMRRTYSFLVQTQWAADEQEPLKAHGVQIYFDGYTESLGTFKPTENSTKFRLEVNEVFILNNIKC